MYEQFLTSDTDLLKLKGRRLDGQIILDLEMMIDIMKFNNEDEKEIAILEKDLKKMYKRYRETR